MLKKIKSLLQLRNITGIENALKMINQINEIEDKYNNS